MVPAQDTLTFAASQALRSRHALMMLLQTSTTVVEATRKDIVAFLALFAWAPTVALLLYNSSVLLKNTSGAV